MIDETLKFVLEELNGFLQNRLHKVYLAVLSGIVNLDGSQPIEISKKVVLTLVNIERETTVASATPRMRVDNDAFSRASPPLNINIYLLVSASFDNDYPESFKLLSAVLGYFQANPVFNGQRSAGFPNGLEKLSFELVNLDFQGLNNLWSNLGGKYLPSVLYKLRMLSIQEGWTLEQVPVITGIDTSL
jgi:hypothetical protein